VREGVAFLDGRLLSQYLKQVAQAVAADDRIKVVPITVVAGHQGIRGPTGPWHVDRGTEIQSDEIQPGG
jgi:hypothetical protein